MSSLFRIVVAAACVLLPTMAFAQGLTGALVGTIRDEQGGVLPGARVSMSSPALIGGAKIVTTDDKGHLRFPALPPGLYVLDIELPGFVTYHETDVLIGGGATIDRSRVLKLAGVTTSVDVQAEGSRLEARGSGFSTRFGPVDFGAIPTRRFSFFDFVKAAPGVSSTSPSSGTSNTFSVFGSGVNENLFLIDGTNHTCPCNGVARAELGVDFIHEVQVQSAGASAEFGNMQGAVVNVVTRSGSNRWSYDGSYYGQPASMTSQPVRMALGATTTGYERVRYRDLTSNIGGPIVRDRLWFFAGYQYLRDYDSQPGTNPKTPRTYEQNKIFAKLTWRLAPGWLLEQSLHQEFWVNPDRPTLATPFEATLRPHATVPALTFAHLTHTSASNTVWDVRVGRFVYDVESPPSTGNRSTASRRDVGTGITSFAPDQFGRLVLSRTTVKATVSHYRSGLWGADHDTKAGVQIERGQHYSSSVTPTGVKYVDNSGQPSQVIAIAPSNTGGVFVTLGAFVGDAVTLGDRLTINAGLRFDHSRAISQDLPAIDLDGRETGTIIAGLGTMYTWNVLSPRLGVTAKLSADGRTILRASFGRYSQGVLTGELAQFHPGATPTITSAFDPATGGYTSTTTRVDTSNLAYDRHTRAPHTDEYSIGVDREVGRRLLVSIAYVGKHGANFIGWQDDGGQYQEGTFRLPDDRTVQVYRLVNAPADRRFLLTNQADYSMTYKGFVMAVEKRRSNGWQAFGSYTFSRVWGLLPSSGTTAAGMQVSTVAPPPLPGGLTFGRDPNDLTNARGRLANDRPQMFRVMGSVDVPRTGIVLAANLQYVSGKPWAATAQVDLPQNAQQRILLEPRGSRRLSSQTLLDLRVSRTLPLGRAGRVDLMVDVLNVLNDVAEEGLVTDNVFATNNSFGKANVFVDPRRVMFGVRVNLGR